MTEREALVRLCQSHGIAPDYFDLWGARHEVANASLRALLGALGVAGGTARQVEEGVRGRERARWHAVLPDVAVVSDEAAVWRVRLCLRGNEADALFSWHIVEESGASREAAFAPAALAVAGSAEVDGERFVAFELVLPRGLPWGYHRLAIRRGGVAVAETMLIVTPARCYQPPILAAGARVWGPALQLYSLRSARNWGIGDFTDLSTVAAQWGRQGAAIVGVNPLHALYPHNPEHASPYSPSSRRFLHVLYIDVEAVEDFRECEDALAQWRAPEFQARLGALRGSELVDYAGVWDLKRAMLELCFAHFCSTHLGRDTPRGRAFRAYQSGHAPALRLHALYEVLQERFHAENGAVQGWPDWPRDYRDPASAEVARFAATHAERVEFYEYLQWQADLQLAAAGRCSLEQGLGVGLYADLAVAVDAAGAEAWANQDLYASGAGVGAPPDDFNLHGQDWGLLPFTPDGLRKAGFAPFIATLRATMRHAGALRIDHVMGLGRLFWVPRGGKPEDGAYVHYPFDEMVGIVALESQRNRCMVIGEDLGTVTDEARAMLARAVILSTRVLYFERREAQEFKPPGHYPRDALVTATTHDLPTLAGFWEGRDLVMREALGLFPSEAVRRAQVDERTSDRWRLLRALEREGLLPEGATLDPASLPEPAAALLLALHAYLARSPSRVMVVQLEDVLGLRDQVNFPGTTTEHPNWRRKLTLALDRWEEDPRFTGLVRVLAAERPCLRPDELLA